MEHKWGLDVTNYGLGNWPVNPPQFVALNPHLCSRILTGGFANWILLGGGGITRPIATFFLVGTQSWVTPSVLPIVPGFPHFPFGYNVEPDVHA